MSEINLEKHELPYTASGKTEWRSYYVADEVDHRLAQLEETIEQQLKRMNGYTDELKDLHYQRQQLEAEVARLRKDLDWWSLVQGPDLDNQINQWKAEAKWAANELDVYLSHDHEAAIADRAHAKRIADGTL